MLGLCGIVGIQARRQARLKARARDERTLAAVACTIHALTGSPPLQKQGRTTIEYNKAQQSRVQTQPRIGDSRPARHAGSRSRMRPTLVALTPMSTLLTTGDCA